MKNKQTNKVYFYLIIATILVLGLCIGGNIYMENTARTIVSEFGFIQADIDTKNWEPAIATFNNNYAYWNRHKKFWQMLINHTEVDDIEVSFLALKGYLETKAKQEATKELYLLKYNILHVPATQSINFSNIF